MLVANNQSIQHYVDQLGFVPEIWSPNYQLVSPKMIEEAHALGMKVIPWTVNTTQEMNDLIEMGVDGIITDYPDSAAVLQ
jgi:glycerophosphoryl diester phosphodiesterase